MSKMPPRGEAREPKEHRDRDREEDAARDAAPLAQVSTSNGQASTSVKQVSGSSGPAAPSAVPASPNPLPASPSAVPASPGTVLTANGTGSTTNGTIPTANGTGPVAPSTGPASPGSLPASPSTVPASPSSLPASPSTGSASPNTGPVANGAGPILNGAGPVASSAAQTSAAPAISPLEAQILRDEPIPAQTAEPPAPTRPWRSYKEILASLAQRVLDAQRPIRILQALRWEPDVEEQFIRLKQRELPKVTYSPDLGFDPAAKLVELEGILRDASRELGAQDRLGQILRATTDEYRQVVRMLTARGTKEFYVASKALYGSPKDKFPDGKTSVRDMGFVLYDLLTGIGGEPLGPVQHRDITAEMAAIELNTRFDRFFGGASIRVQVDDSLLADAAAGSDYVKIRSGAMFSRSDIDILEAHEGWVHVATSLNGQAQPVARWLAKGPPRTTAAQEGLAALVEIFTFRSTPRRAKNVNDRILPVDKAEDGASFLDVFEWYRTEGYEEEECFQNARRVFRGGLLEGGGPFTKDACYCKGIVLNYAFMRAAIQHDHARLIPFLFVGKVAHEDVPVLYAHITDGIVKPPPYLPPMFDDMNGLAIWICYSSFFSRFGSTAIADYYAKLMAR